MERLDEQAHATSEGESAAAEPFRLAVCWSPYEWMTRAVEALEAETPGTEDEDES